MVSVIMASVIIMANVSVTLESKGAGGGNFINLLKFTLNMCFQEKQT